MEYTKDKRGYTQNGIKPYTNNSTYYNNKDLYDTIELAEDRSYNIGGSGYRKVFINANGDYKYSPCSSIEQYHKLIKEMPKISMDKKYYQYDERENIYDIEETIHDKLYSGFDYKNEILKRSLSNVFYKDPIKENILSFIDKVIYGLIETTKQIKNFGNFTVKKNNRRVF